MNEADLGTAAELDQQILHHERLHQQQGAAISHHSPATFFFSILHCSHFTHWITGILRLRDETQRVCLSVAFALIACFVSEMSLERFCFALQCINGMYGQQLFARRWPWPLIYVEQLQRHQSISNQPSAIHHLEQLSEKYLHFILLIVSSDLQSI